MAAPGLKQEIFLAGHPLRDHLEHELTKGFTEVDRFIPSAAWGANPSKDATEDSHPIGGTLGVTLHWEGPHMGDFPHSACADKVRGIERFHEYGRGWGDVAYNLLVCPHGYVYEGRGAGVRSAANGTDEANDAWYAVCYLGGQGDGFTREGRDGMLWAVGYLRQEGQAGAAVNGHRDHKGTECPGDEIYRWLRRADFPHAVERETGELDVDEQTLRRIMRDEINRASWGALWRIEVLVREILDRLGGSPHKAIEAARARRQENNK